MLSLDELRLLDELTAASPIGVAEIRASAKQLAFQRAFFERRDETGRPCSIFAALGANRSGKTVVSGWLCFAKYLRDCARDGDWFWCVGQTLDRSIGGQQKELWTALPRWMFGGDRRGVHGWEDLAQQWNEKIGFGAHRKIVLPTVDGGRCLVEFRSADQAPSTFEQAKLRGAWIDERCPEEVYDRLLARIIDRDGWILISDIPEQWWQYQRLAQAEPAAGVYFRHMTMYDNARNLPAGAIESAKARMTADQQALRIDGEFQVMEGLVYKEFRTKKHVVEPFPKGVPAHWPRWRAIDYGGSNPTACLWFALSPTEKMYIYREYYQRGGSIETHAAAINEASEGETYRDTFIDPPAFHISPANRVTIAQQYKALGITARGWPLVNKMGEHAMVQRVKYRLEHGTIAVFANCTNTIREFASWKYKTDKEGNPVEADAFENANNHALDTIKGFEATRPCFAEGKIEVYGGDQAPPEDAE